MQQSHDPPALDMASYTCDLIALVRDRLEQKELGTRARATCVGKDAFFLLFDAV